MGRPKSMPQTLGSGRAKARPDNSLDVGFVFCVSHEVTCERLW